MSRISDLIDDPPNSPVVVLTTKAMTVTLLGHARKWLHTKRNVHATLIYAQASDAKPIKPPIKPPGKLKRLN